MLLSRTIFCDDTHIVISRRVFFSLFVRSPEQVFWSDVSDQVWGATIAVYLRLVLGGRAGLSSPSIFGSFLWWRVVSASYEGCCRAKMSLYFQSTSQLCLSFFVKEEFSHRSSTSWLNGFFFGQSIRTSRSSLSLF